MAQVVLRLTLGTNAVGPFSIYTGSTTGTPILASQTRDQLVAGVVYNFPAEPTGTQYTLTFENNQPGCEDQTVTKSIIIYGNLNIIDLTVVYEPGSVVASYTAKPRVIPTSDLTFAFDNVLITTTGGTETLSPSIVIPANSTGATETLTATTLDYTYVDQNNVTFSGFTFNGVPSDGFNFGVDTNVIFDIPVSPTPTPTSTPTPSVTPTGGDVSPTPTATVTPTSTITPSVTPSVTVSTTPDVSPGVSPSPTPSITSTQSVTPTPTITPTSSVTPTNTPQVTNTATPTTSVTPTSTPISTSTPTTSVPPTSTPTPTPSSSEVVDTVWQLRRINNFDDCSIDLTVYRAVNTLGAVSANYILGTDGFCYLVVNESPGTVNVTMSTGPYIECSSCLGPSVSQTPTTTSTPTPTITPTSSVTPTLTPTQSITPTVSVTPTITPTSSITPTVSVTPTQSITPTASVTPTQSITPTASVTPTLTPTSTVTPSVTPSITPSVTLSVTPTQTVTPTASITPTSSITPTVSITPSITPTSTTTPTPTASITPSATVSVTPTLTPTPSITPSVAGVAPALLFIEPDSLKNNIAGYMNGQSSAWLGFGYNAPTTSAQIETWMEMFATSGVTELPEVYTSTIPQDGDYLFNEITVPSGTVSGNAWYTFLIPQDSIGGVNERVKQILKGTTSPPGDTVNTTDTYYNIEVNYTGPVFVNTTYRLYTSYSSQDLRLDDTSSNYYFAGGDVSTED